MLNLIALLSLAGAPVIGPINPGLIVDPCGTGVADASATLGADVDSRELVSTGTPTGNQYWLKSGCKRFVADFTVPANANPASMHGILTFDLGGMFSVDPGQASSCNTAELSVATFEKVAGANNFVKRTSAKYKGHWSSGMFQMCNFVKVSGSNPPSDTPNADGTEIWRVAVSGTNNGASMHVKARIGFQQIPW